MQSLMVDGGRRLSGEVKISGSKNAVLPMLAATVLFQEPCRICNCPKLTDVDAAVEILEYLGAKTWWDGRCLTVDPRLICRWQIPAALMDRMRASVLFTGALLARMGRCRLIRPGGCVLGDRPVDYHVRGLQTLGAVPDPQDPSVLTGELAGTELTLPYPSVGATENLILTALGASGVTTIHNAAMEPEIVCLCDFLRLGGCRIRGDGTPVIQICGGMPSGAEMKVIPDRMEAATFACAAAATGGDVVLNGADTEQIRPVLDVLAQAGCDIISQQGAVAIHGGELTAPHGVIVTAPYPGFPTDAQAPVMAAMLRASGTTVLRETVFPQRMNHISGFRAMGARIEMDSGQVRIYGGHPLHGAAVTAPDLRGGAALTIAALSACGETEIFGLSHILRGYEDFAGKLRALGARIRQA